MVENRIKSCKLTKISSELYFGEVPEKIEISEKIYAEKGTNDPRKKTYQELPPHRGKWR